MSFTGQSTCLRLQSLLLLLIGFCHGQSGTRTGSGHRYGGGRGFAVLNNQDSSSSGDGGEQQEVDQRIVILLLCLLAIAVLGLLWQWCTYCHKILNPPAVVKLDPEEQRKELEARYRALQQRFRDGQTTSTDSFNPPISALEAVEGVGGGVNDCMVEDGYPPSAPGPEIGWQIAQQPPQATPPSSKSFRAESSTPLHLRHERTISATTTTTTTTTTIIDEDGQVVITVSSPLAEATAVE